MSPRSLALLSLLSQLTPAIKEYVLNKVGSAVATFSSHESGHTAVVRLSARKRSQHGAPTQRCEITLNAGWPHTGKVIRAEVEDTLLYAAIDLASDVLSRSLRELKQRDIKSGMHSHHLGGAKSAEALHLLELQEEEAYEPEMDAALREAAVIPASVIRRKLFTVATVSASEAVEKMEDLCVPLCASRDCAL